jgi:hypothetical protein
LVNTLPIARSIAFYSTFAKFLQDLLTVPSTVLVVESNKPWEHTVLQGGGGGDRSGGVGDVWFVEWLLANNPLPAVRAINKLFIDGLARSIVVLGWVTFVKARKDTMFCTI